MGTFPTRADCIATVLSLVTLICADTATAQPLVTRIGAPALDCRNTYPNVVIDHAVAGYPVNIHVLTHPQQPANEDQPTSAPGHPGSTVMLVGMVANDNDNNIDPIGMDIGAGLRLYTNTFQNLVSFPIQQADANGLVRYTVNLPADSAGKRILFQAYAAAPATSNSAYPARHCTSDSYSGSFGEIVTVQPQTNSGPGIISSNTLTDGGITLTFDQAYQQGTLADGKRYVIAPNGVNIIGTSHPSQHELSEQLAAITQATGGTFRLTYNGQTTAPIAYNASAAQVKAALEALSNITTVTVYDDNASANGFYYYSINFVSPATPTSLMSIDGSALSASVSWYNPQARIVARVKNGGTWDYIDDAGYNPFDNGKLEGSRTDLGYNASRNRAFNSATATQPLTIPANSTFIQCRSRANVFPGANNGTANMSSCLEYLTLYVARAKLPDGAFRPTYAAGPRPIFATSSIRNELLLDLEAPSNSMLSFAQVMEIARRRGPNIASGGTAYRALLTTANYGRDYSAQKGDALLYLLLAVLQSEKNQVLVNLIQDAIDQWGISNTNRSTRLNTWSNQYYDGQSGNGGHQQAGLTNALLGAILNEPAIFDMYKNGKRAGEHATYVTLSAAQVASGNYPTSMIGRGEWKMSRDVAPNPDLYGNPYRTCCTATAVQGTVLFARLLGLEGVLALPALPDYLTRYNTSIVTDGGWTQFYTAFTREMYLLYGAP